MGEPKNKPAGDEDHAGSSNDPPWSPLDPETARGDRGLTALLRHRLGDRNDEQLTFAQRLTQKLINGALAGNARYLEEILVRIDGEAKSREPAAKSAKASVNVDVDEVTALRILDALHDEPDHLAGH